MNAQDNTIKDTVNLAYDIFLEALETFKSKHKLEDNLYTLEIDNFSTYLLAQKNVFLYKTKCEKYARVSDLCSCESESELKEKVKNRVIESLETNLKRNQSGGNVDGCKFTNGGAIKS